MEQIQIHITFWAYTLLICTALGLLLTIPKFGGKGWVILFLVLRCVVRTSYYVPQLWLLSGANQFQEYEAFIYSWGLIFQLLDVLSYATIVAFLLALKPSLGAHAGDRSRLFSFRGRVGRQFFWIVSITLIAVNVVAYLILTAGTGRGRATSSGGAGIIVAIICIALWFLISSWISLATQVKRWHDLDKSGWWILIGLIPIIGGIWALVETGFFRGTIDANQFGPRPGQQSMVSSSEGLLPAQESSF